MFKVESAPMRCIGTPKRHSIFYTAGEEAVEQNFSFSQI